MSPERCDEDFVVFVQNAPPFHAEVHLQYHSPKDDVHLIIGTKNALYDQLLVDVGSIDQGRGVLQDWQPKRGFGAGRHFRPGQH